MAHHLPINTVVSVTGQNIVRIEPPEPLQNIGAIGNSGQCFSEHVGTIVHNSNNVTIGNNNTMIVTTGNSIQQSSHQPVENQLHHFVNPMQSSPLHPIQNASDGYCHSSHGFANPIWPFTNTQTQNPNASFSPCASVVVRDTRPHSPVRQGASNVGQGEMGATAGFRQQNGAGSSPFANASSVQSFCSSSSFAPHIAPFQASHVPSSSATGMDLQSDYDDRLNMQMQDLNLRLEESPNVAQALPNPSRAAVLPSFTQAQLQEPNPGIQPPFSHTQPFQHEQNQSVFVQPTFGQPQPFEPVQDQNALVQSFTPAQSLNNPGLQNPASLGPLVSNPSRNIHPGSVSTTEQPMQSLSAEQNSFQCPMSLRPINSGYMHPIPSDIDMDRIDTESEGSSREFEFESDLEEL